MKETTPQFGGLRRVNTQPQVHQGKLGSATAQRLYRLRCECGRAWFELETPGVVRCPACLRLSAVTLLESPPLAPRGRNGAKRDRLEARVGIEGRAQVADSLTRISSLPGPHTP